MRIVQVGSGIYEGALAEMGALAAVCGAGTDSANSYDTLAGALESEKFDGVAAAPACAAADIMAAIRAKKHVLVENPAYGPGEWADMAEAAGKNRTILARGNPDRFNPALCALKDSRYGNITSMEFSGWGADGMVSCMDIACWLSGAAPNVVFARGGDHMTVMLGYDDKTAVISGRTGARRAGMVSGDAAVSADLGTREITTERDGRTEVRTGGSGDPLLLEMRGFADAMDGKKSHVAGPQEAADAAEAARAALLSSQKGIPVYLG